MRGTSTRRAGRQTPRRTGTRARRARRGHLHVEEHVARRRAGSSATRVRRRQQLEPRFAVGAVLTSGAPAAGERRASGEWPRTARGQRAERRDRARRRLGRDLLALDVRNARGGRTSSAPRTRMTSGSAAVLDRQRRPPAGSATDFDAAASARRRRSRAAWSPRPACEHDVHPSLARPARCLPARSRARAAAGDTVSCAGRACVETSLHAPARSPLDLHEKVGDAPIHAPSISTALQIAGAPARIASSVARRHLRAVRLESS